VVLVARGGKPFFHRAYGMADRDKSLRNRTTTRFDIGSITKLITKTAVGQLLRGGKLRLDDTVAKLLPDYPHLEIAGPITIQQLLDHRSGLGDIFNDRWDDAPKDELIRPGDFFSLFADLPLQFEPGTSRAYSNAGYIMLGAIVEAAVGKPYAEYVEQKIFRPSGMVRSGFPVRDGSVSDLAIGYTREGAEGEGGEPRPNLGMLPLQGCPAGSSSHAAEDLLKLDRALRDGSLLGPWTDWVFTGVAPADGATKKRDAGSPAGHGIGVAGGGPGVNAGLESNGETTVVVLANQDPPVAMELASQISRALSKP
jgi:CubicO group peptidase (beta-lactamase class C family)